MVSFESQCYVAMSYMYVYVGAFGVVHKGEFVDSDGSMMPIAIKTIKCKNFNYVLVQC